MIGSLYKRPRYLTMRANKALLMALGDEVYYINLDHTFLFHGKNRCSYSTVRHHSDLQSSDFILLCFLYFQKFGNKCMCSDSLTMELASVLVEQEERFQLCNMSSVGVLGMGYWPGASVWNLHCTVSEGSCLSSRWSKTDSCQLITYTRTEGSKMRQQFLSTKNRHFKSFNDFSAVTDWSVSPSIVSRPSTQSTTGKHQRHSGSKAPVKTHGAQCLIPACYHPILLHSASAVGRKYTGQLWSMYRCEAWSSETLEKDIFF